jgi:uncharacterized protein (UPF0332 family)
MGVPAQRQPEALMNFRDYLPLARSLVTGSTEAEWRTAISRAYYAAFHVARDLLIALGFQVPRADRAHGYLWIRLANSGEAAVQMAGNRLNALRGQRNRADYDQRSSIPVATATNDVQAAEDIIRALDAAAVDPIRSQITTTMRDYERDILKDVTWQPPPP